MNYPDDHSILDRRHFLAGSGLGVGSLALDSLRAESTSESVIEHHPGRVRSVIFLFMSGGPSQVDTFDPKPELAKLAGGDVPESLARTVPNISRAGLKNLMASPWRFHQYGES